jgi:hypothetical protein
MGEMMGKRVIIRREGKIGARIEQDDYDTMLMTVRNGWQWAGVPISPRLAELIVEVLQEYIRKENEAKKVGVKK